MPDYMSSQEQVTDSNPTSLLNQLIRSYSSLAKNRNLCLINGWSEKKKQVFSLYLQEHLLPIHHPKDEVDDGGIAEGDKCRV